LEEVGGVDGHDDLIVVEGVLPYLRVGRALHPDVDGRYTLGGEELYQLRREVLVDENVHPPPRTNLSFFRGRPPERYEHPGELDVLGVEGRVVLLYQA